MLASLPNEVTIQIFKYLGLQDLATCHQVCKKWRQCAGDQSLWKDLFFRNFPLENPSQIQNWKEAYRSCRKFLSQLQKRTYSVARLKLPTLYHGLVVSKDRMAICDGSHEVKVWDLKTLKCEKALKGHALPVTCLFAEQDQLFSGSLDYSVREWNLNTGECAHVFNVSSIPSCFTLAGNRLLTGMYDSTIKILNLQTLALQSLSGHEGIVSCLFVSHLRLFSGSQDKTIKIWNLNTLVCEKTLTGHGNGITGIICVGSTLISGSWDCNVRVWDLDKQVCTIILRHKGGVNCLAAKADRLFAATSDGLITVYCFTGSLQDREYFTEHLQSVRNLVISDSRIISNTHDGETRISDFSQSASSYWDYLNPSRCALV